MSEKKLYWIVFNKARWWRDPKLQPFDSSSFVSCRRTTILDLLLIQYMVGLIQLVTTLGGVHFWVAAADPISRVYSALRRLFKAYQRLQISNGFFKFSFYPFFWKLLNFTQFLNFSALSVLETKAAAMGSSAGPGAFAALKMVAFWWAQFCWLINSKITTS